jgi:hypothetical protein
VKVTGTEIVTNVFLVLAFVGIGMGLLLLYPPLVPPLKATAVNARRAWQASPAVRRAIKRVRLVCFAIGALGGVGLFAIRILTGRLSFR